MHLGFVLRVLCVIQVVWIGTAAATKIGVIYGEEAALAAGGAENAVQLLRAQGIHKLRLYDADSAMLRALGGSSIEVIVGLRNDELVDVGVSKTSAHSWVARNVEAYFPDTKITAIAVGDEILTNKDESLVPFLVPAMRNIHAALAAAGLEQAIKVSTPQSLRLLSTFSPPSLATFDASLSTRVLAPVLEFLSLTESYFMLNLHPFDVQQANPRDLTLGHALYSTESGIDDHVTGLHYANKFEALVDAVYVAMASLNHPELDVVVTEAGWSKDSAANDDPAAVSFHADLLKHIASGTGTPFKPRKGAISTFVQASLLSSLEASTGDVEFLRAPGSAAMDSGVRRKLLADKTWCIAKEGSRTEDLQLALDWACSSTGGQADCRAIQSGQFCFLPNTMRDHASYAFNSYYQKVSWAAGSCDFNGLAEVTSTDPSYPGCLYVSSGSDPTNSTSTTSVATRHQFSLAWLALVLAVTWKLTFM
ncbi:protein MpGH17.14 [Marchantia polymorpha subsp. ruderalis]|uniref:X8 domain-containing protein n=2 Tax=Marchantia polymorpha TaxID=3197 RepID=A0AAF6B7Z1_MARPO|nr:hypothetical protein MARPO_0112s0010 [Marchantia polymorpha]BBN08125.1 hypothetical protein Mp_4g09090 [Marchantia polymorpha subsp. ruderalis]|eukprot:PTQ31350.1 hypothetical protein MARPO_0112s0010 [Marchantia polymorpha]